MQVRMFSGCSVHLYCNIPCREPRATESASRVSREGVCRTTLRIVSKLAMYSMTCGVSLYFQIRAVDA